MLKQNRSRINKIYVTPSMIKRRKRIQKDIRNLEKNVTFLNRNWISPRKLIPDQGKVYPRAVFTPRGSALQPRAKRGL